MPPSRDDPPDADIDALADELGRALVATGRTVTTVESCTGGLIAAAITSVAGSSAWFRAGWVTYANAAKVALAGVPDAVLAAHGAVSEATVEAMARGALARADADVAIAVSGIAGPGGAVPGKPVGTVWLAVAAAIARTGSAGPPALRAEGGGEPVAATVRTACHRFPGGRSDVRRAAVVHGLRATLSVLSEPPS